MSTCAAGYADHVEADMALAFVARQLGENERGEVERRIDACAGCRGVVAEAARDTRGSTPTVNALPPGSQPRAYVEPVIGAGETVGRYLVERPLGAGGMGVVYLARDPELRRAVVVKLVRPDAADVDLEARLRREAQAMAQLSHPNVVQIFDIGRHGDRVFLAMEFIAGETLDVWMIEKERTPAEIIAMFLQCGAGLEAAHRAGLLHRDFKPTNVLVDRSGIAKVTDFGLARALGAPAAGSAKPRVSGVHAVLTHHDAVIGTPAYMAPEQTTGEPLDARTDQFALALALLDALTGQHPTRRSIHPDQSPPEIEAALTNVVPRVRQAIARALSQAPAQRFPDLSSFLRELAPRSDRKWWPLIAATLVVAGIIGVAVWFVTRTDGTCFPEAPNAWARGPRETVRTKLAGRERPFAAWHADYVLAKIDAAAADIGSQEVAKCQGKSVDTACLQARRKALDGVASLSLDNPVTELRTIESCKPIEDEHDLRALRTELATANAQRAREIGEKGDDLLEADALDIAARQEIERGYFAEAAEDFVGEASTGDRAGDDSLRARALLGLLDVARLRGDLTAARDAIKQLDGLLERHRNAPADVFVVAMAAAGAYFELGDVDATFAAIDRAKKAALTDDDRLRTLVAYARALKLHRIEDQAADTALDEALALKKASALARAEALALAVDFALDRGNAAVARKAVDEVMRIRKSALADQLREARVRALEGHTEEALADLSRISIADPTTHARIEITRARIHGSKNPAQMTAELKPMFQRTRVPSSASIEYERNGLSTYEKADAENLWCSAVTRECFGSEHVEKMHPRSPQLAQHKILYFKASLVENPSISTGPLHNAIEIHAANGARPLYVAELRLELVRHDKLFFDPKKHAAAAREVFAAAGRTAEVEELDRLVVEIDNQFKAK